jgi:hypothetical protein
MKLVEFQRLDGVPVWVNPEYVILVEVVKETETQKRHVQIVVMPDRESVHVDGDIKEIARALDGLTGGQRAES